MRPALSRLGRGASLAVTQAALATLAAMAGLAGLPATAVAGAAPVSASGPLASAAAAASTAWRQQFDDPVLTSLLAALPVQDGGRAQALARQWVAVRVFHAQWSAMNALAQLAQDTQAMLMDLPPGTTGREDRLARVATQLAQTRQLATQRAARRDDAIDAVARLSVMAPQDLVARIGQPLTEWRLPHLVAEPPTVRLTVSPATSTLAQRLTDLHACHEAALQADRQALAARQQLAQAQAQTQARTGTAGGAAAEATGASASPGAGAGAGAGAAMQPMDAATAQAWQDLLLALSAQAAAAGDLALAWLDYLAVAPAPAASAAGHATPHTPSRPA